MAKAKTTKKAPKKKVDYRFTESELNKRQSSFAREWTEAFLHKTMRGYINLSTLTKKVNKKYADALLATAPIVTLVSDDAEVSTSVSIEDFAHSRNGDVVRIKVRTDNYKTGESSADYELIVNPGAYYINNVGNKPMICEVMSRVTSKMYDIAEENYNNALFKAGLAPSADYRYDED